MNGLNIAALSRRTGVAADTLRKWEQRYGVLQPARTAGGQRRYSDLDVARVEWLRARLTEGYRIGEAAALLGTGAWRAARTPGELVEELASAVAAGDAAALEQLLDQAFALEPAEAFAEVLEPLFARIGDAWEKGLLSVAHEHLATQAIRVRLGRRLSEARGGVRGTAVLACLPGERHDVGLLMLAVLLQADGWSVAYLGADTPVDAALSLARTLGASLLCYSTTHGGNDRLALGPTPDGTTAVLGGRAASEELAERLGAVHAAARAADAVADLRRYAAA
jgi:MerR family transcriptional regulator, light-induced transcriptional regulator